MSYYNTTKEEKDLKKYHSKADTQDQMILNYFHEHVIASPSEVWVWFSSNNVGNVPITSIRRSITDLTNEGKLFKTRKKRRGYYGRDEYIWTIPSYNFTKENKNA
jgi:hypothetical protein|tara:strand:- start:1325 stop:1639 length:315 start_codon:yes stop_codon:yes gene_type:complete